MSDPERPFSDEQALSAGDDPLPPEHPAGSDAPVSAGEVLSGEGLGTAGPGPSPAAPNRPDHDRIPGDDA